MGQAAPQDDSSIIVSLSEAAMHMYSAAIDALPFAEDKKVPQTCGRRTRGDAEVAYRPGGRSKQQ